MCTGHGRLKSIKNLNQELDSGSLLLEEVSRATDLMPNPVLKHNTCFHLRVLEPTRGYEVSQRERLVIRPVSCLISRPFMGINQRLFISDSWHGENFKEILHLVPALKTVTV